MGWTFDPMPTPELARHCKAIGLVAMEGLDEKHFPAKSELRLAVSLVGSHGQGYVAQEFIPTWPDRLMALRHAAKVCDV